MSWQIAIDGPAGSGKTTIAKELAKKLNFVHIDTGSMYRAIAYKAIKLGIDLNNEDNYSFLESTKVDFINGCILLDGIDISSEIRTLEISNAASLVSSFASVRKKLVALQKQMSEDKNVIMDGRDIGTVVLPNADLKIYLTATVEERAKRRLIERQNNNHEFSDLETTIREIIDRDFKDSNRKIDPLCKADDAIEIDSSKLSVEEVINKITSLVSKRGYKMENLEQKIGNVEEEKEEMKEEKLTEEVKVEEVVEETVEAAVEETSSDVKEEVEEKVETPNEEPSKKEYKELQLVTGTVIEVQDAKEARGNLKAKEERVLIELEDHTEGFLFRKDTANISEDEDLFDIFVEGETVEVVIKKIFPDGGKFIFSTILVERRKELQKFEELIKQNAVLTAKVIKQVPNFGLLLKYEAYSCLLPTSLVSVPAEEIESLIGKEIEVVPIRVDLARIRVIVSQKKAEGIKNKQTKKEFLDKIEVGQEYEGVVKNVEAYGAFVDLGQGVEGLLHISEIDHNRVSKVEKVLNIGDTVKVKVIKVENEHIGLSRKALLPNKWEIYFADKGVDSVVSGKIVKIDEKGINVELTEDIVGFIPKPQFAWEKQTYVEDFVALGDEIETKIIETDASKRRIILSRKALTENPWDNVTRQINDIVDVTIVKVLKEGFKVALDGMIGYLPKASVKSVDPETVLEGQVLKVKIKVLDIAKTRLIVNMRDAEEKQERDSYSKYMKPQQEKISNTFGDFMPQDKKKKK